MTKVQAHICCQTHDVDRLCLETDITLDNKFQLKKKNTKTAYVYGIGAQKLKMTIKNYIRSRLKLISNFQFFTYDSVPRTNIADFHGFWAHQSQMAIKKLDYMAIDF